MKHISCKPGDRVELGILGERLNGTVEAVAEDGRIYVQVDGYPFSMTATSFKVKRVIAPAASATPEAGHE